MLASRNSNLSTFSAISINYSTLVGSSITTSTITNSTINASTITTRQVNYSTLAGSSIVSNMVIGGTVAINSTMISLGSSTNQSYINLAQGNFSTASSWVSTLNTASTIKFVSMSGNAQTQLAVSQVSTISSLYYTSTLGQSWAVLSGASGLPTATQTNYSAGAVSGDGRVGVLATSTITGGQLYITSTFTSTPSFTAINPIISASTPFIYLPFETVPVNGAIGGTTLTVTGSPTLVTGIVGLNALNLANTAGGTPTQYIRGTISLMPSCTISLWINVSSFNGFQNIFGMYNNTFNLFIFTGTNKLTLAVPTGVGTASTLLTDFTISLNTWYSVYIIFQTGGLCSFYVNNNLIGTYSNTGTASFTSSGVFSLGSRDDTIMNAFNGYIDDLRIYNTAVAFTPMIVPNWNNVALSNSGQYMLATVANGGLFMSSNSGSTWSQVTSELLAANWSSLAISATGQYMLAYSDPVLIQPQLTGLGSNSWQVNGISWVASASSTGQSPSYVLFDTLIDQYWTSAQTNLYNGSGVYVGTTSTYVNGSGSVTGEWIQIQSSVPIQIYSYTLNAGSYTQYSNGLTVAGSNDGSNWYLLQSVTMSGNPIGTAGAATSTSYIIVNQSGAQTMTTTGGSATFTCTTSAYSANPYTYFRLIFPASFGSSGFIALTEWLIRFNAGGQAYSTNFGSTWQNGYTLATPSALSLSGSGQYAIGGYGLGSTLLPLITQLNFENTITDSQGYLTYSNNLGGINYSSTAKIGSSSLNLTNPSSGAQTSTLNYSLSPTTFANLTISFWIYPSSFYNLSILGFNATGGTVGPYFGLTSSGQVLWAYYTTSTSGAIISTATISVNTWSHIAITYGASFTTLYVNGTSAGTLSVTGSLSLSTAANITYLTFGGNNPVGSPGYNGLLDDFRLYNQALTVSQITSIYTTSLYSGASVVSNYLAGFSTGTYSTPTFSPILSTTNIPVASAISTTGQYMAIITNGTTNVYYSTNYGSTFTGLTVGSTAMTTCAISGDGSYITVSNGTTVYQLNNNSNGFSLALGNQAGQQNQGQNAIAIGNQAGQINQSANSIILNASGSVINPVAQGFYVAPIAQYGSSTSSLSLLAYGTDNQVVQTFSLLSLSAGNVGIGTTAPVGALSLQLDGNGNYNPAMWTSSYALFGTGVGSTIGSAVAITYNSVGNYGALLSLSPNIAWRPMYYSALSHTFMYGPGNATFGMIIASGGNVGIGTQSPTSILTLNNNSAAFTSQLLLKGKDYYTGTTGTSGTGIAINLGVNNINNKQLYLTDPDLAINTTNPLLNFTVGGDKCYIRGLSTDGTTALPVYMGSSLLSAGDGTTNLGASGYRFGAVFAVNGTIQTSDSSEKDLTILPYGLTELMQMKTIMYKWKSQAFLPDTDPAKNYQYYGVCADQLSAIFPELVYNEDPSVPMQLNYSEIIPVVVKAMQEQNVSIQEQSTKIQQQATQIQKQATEITALQLTVASQSTQVLQAQLTAQQIQIAQLMQRLSAAGIA